MSFSANIDAVGTCEDLISTTPKCPFVNLRSSQPYTHKFYLAPSSMIASCEMLLTVLLMAHLMLWLSDPNCTVLLFLLIHLKIFGTIAGCKNGAANVCVGD